MKGVGQHAEARNANLDAIPSLERTHPGRSSGQHQVAGFKGEDGADIGEQPGDGKDEVEGRGVLAQLAVDAGFQGQPGRGIQLVADDGANRSKGVEALGAGPLAILALQVASGHVVGQRVAAQGGAPFFFFQIADAAADHQRQLTFKVHAG